MKITPKNELIEELMEAVAYYSNFASDLDEIIKALDSNEELDHENDKIRNETMKFLLAALEAFSAKRYEDMDKYVHAATQKLHSQEMLDLKDDKPRTEARIKLALARQKAIHNKELLAKFLGEIKDSPKLTLEPCRSRKK